jgi:hypothetical protein
MTRVRAKLQDIPLGDSHVFHKSPRRMRQICRADTAQVRGEISNGLFETQVRAPTTEEIQYVLPQCIFIVHALAPYAAPLRM